MRALPLAMRAFERAVARIGEPNTCSTCAHFSHCGLQFHGRCRATWWRRWVVTVAVEKWFACDKWRQRA